MQYYKLIAEPMHYYQLLIDNYVVGSEWQDDVTMLVEECTNDNVDWVDK